MVRFMDDIYLFDNSERVLTEDYQTVQKLLGEKALSVNTAKCRDRVTRPRPRPFTKRSTK
jgi:hypothetical protein